MRRLILILTVLITYLPYISSAMPSAFPTGTVFYNPDKAFNGFIVFSSDDHKTHLIDMNGNEVHQWRWEGEPAWPIPPSLANGQLGHLLVRLSSVKNPSKFAIPGTGLENAIVGEVDWQGNIIRQYGSQAAPIQQSHEMRRLANGNDLLLSNEIRQLAGWHSHITDSIIKEFNPAGQLVWQWSAADHLAQFGFSEKQQQAIKDSDHPDFLHLNTAIPVGQNHWFTAGDKRFAPDNIIINSRNINIMAIIDKQTGQIIWHMGPNYPTLQIGQPLPRPVDQIIGEHHVHMIPENLPGAGNLLIFDNQGNAGFPPAFKNALSASRVIEVNPSAKTIVWEYTALNSNQALYNFYSSFLSSAQRLPNGNTLIDEGQDGRLFQVTPKGEIVWEYINPFFGKDLALFKGKAITNKIYRAYLVNYNWAPKGTPYNEQAIKADCLKYPLLPTCPLIK